MAIQTKKYVALIGDLVGSRRLSPEERAEVQKRFLSVLNKINRDFKKEIDSLFLITAGDEMQGILNSPNCCFQVVRQIQIELAPTEIVFGIGYGILTTEIGEYAIGADGPAFHLARQALNESKAERKAYGKSLLREVRFHSGEPMRDSIIDSLFLALAVIKSHWTNKQQRILNLLEQGKSSTEIAKFLNIPLSNISRTVERAHFREFEYLGNNLVNFFQKSFTKLT